MSSVHPEAPSKVKASSGPRSGPSRGEDAPATALKAQVIENFKRLYPMPHVVVKARRVMADPNSSVEQLAAVLRADPALAGRIVKVANSAYYRRRGPVASVQQAAALLGLRNVSQIITLVSHSKMLGQALEGYGLEAGDLWRHSLRTAVFSEELSARAGGEYASEAFLAGLMHDAGKIILNATLLEQSGNGPVAGFGAEGVRAETRILGFDHADIGSELCIKWQLPMALANALRYHHMPHLSADNGLAYVLNLADFLAHRGSELEEGPEAWSVVQSPLSRLGFEPKDALAALTAVESRLEALEEDTL